MLFSSAPIRTFSCPLEGAPSSLFSAAKYTSVPMLEKPSMSLI